MSYSIENVWTADVGPQNAAWLADPGNFEGQVVATDLGDGTVTIDEDGMDVLRDLDTGSGTPGDLGWDDGDDGGGLSIHLPYEHPAGSGYTEFWLISRRVPVAADLGEIDLRSG